MELKVTIVHETWDMSIHNVYSRCQLVDASDLKAGASIDLGALDGGVLTILAVDPEAVSLVWEKEKYIVPMMSSVETPVYRVPNPYLTADSVNLIFEYRTVPEAIEK